MSSLFLEDALSGNPTQRKEQLANLARHAEAAERYEDMCKFMKVRPTTRFCGLKTRDDRADM